MAFAMRMRLSDEIIKTKTFRSYYVNGKKNGFEFDVQLAYYRGHYLSCIEQLEVWAERAGVDLIKQKEGSDPAAVVYDTIQAGIARDTDIIIIDTAGRLHNKKNLRDELAKIYRVVERELPYADREIFRVLDATTGQNAVSQAKECMQVAELTGIVLTKLDGTARGGVVLAIKNELKLPIKFIGVGEQLDDLQPFDQKVFAKALFENTAETHAEED